MQERDWRLIQRASCTALLVVACIAFPRDAAGAPPWVERPITLPQQTLAVEGGLAMSYVRDGAPVAGGSLAGTGASFGARYGIFDFLEVDLRVGADDYYFVEQISISQLARPFGYQTFHDDQPSTHPLGLTPDARVRGALVRGTMVEIGLELRITERDLMAGYPLRFHIARAARVDVGAFLTSDSFGGGFPRFASFVVPVEAWWQATPRLALGILTGVRSSPGVSVLDPVRRTSVTAGAGGVVSLTRRLDLKTMLYTPRLQSAWELGDGYPSTDGFDDPRRPHRLGVALAVALEGRLERNGE